MPVSTPFALTWTGTDIDNVVVSFEIAQAEGDFATLTLVVQNPRVGLLSGNLWATLSYNGDPLFYGRLLGLPQDMQGELVTLQFIARPDDYEEQKATAAEALKVAPFWDSVFVPPDRVNDPDWVLESRPALWHTDRVTHDVTASDILVGEAGTTVIPVAFYDSVKVSVGEPAAEQVTCHAEIRWSQAAEGNIDLTQKIWKAFDDIGSTNGPCITSYTGGGLYTSWPVTGASIGSGWTVGDSFAIRGDGNGIPSSMLSVQAGKGNLKGNTGVGGDGTYHGLPDVVTVDDEGNPIPAGATITIDDSGNMTVTPPQTTFTTEAPALGYTPVFPNYYKTDMMYEGEPSYVGFPLWAIFAGIKVNYDVSRERTEIVDFVLHCGVQPLVSARPDQQLSFDLSGQVDQPIDPDGRIPIGDVRRKSYMLTDRGHRSLEYMIASARARLLASARAVRVSFGTTFDVARALSLRHSVTLDDGRLPGGTATGKIVGLTFGLDGSSGTLAGSVTFACTVGTGEANPLGGVPPADNPIPYIAAEYIAGGYYSTDSATDIAGDTSYWPYDNTVLDDDGVDLFGMDAETAVEELIVSNGSADQAIVLLSGSFADTNSATSALNEAATHIALTMKPLQTNRAFVSTFNITVEDLLVPKTIDLSAPSSS